MNLTAVFAMTELRPPPAPPRQSPAGWKVAIAWSHLTYQQALAQFRRRRSPDARARCAQALLDYDRARVGAERRF